MHDVPIERLKVLVVAPYINKEGLGEGYSMFQWVEALCARADVTVIALTGKYDLAAQLPNARVIAMRAPSVLSKFPRFNYMAKPWHPIFLRWVRKWLKAALARGEQFDIAHQILPQAMRYPVPLHGLGIPYVVGPLGGSLETPKGFRKEVSGGGLFARLRALDRLRLRTDPWLRRGYAEADLILGVAPYVGETLRDAGLAPRRFEPVLERAHEGSAPIAVRDSGIGEAHLIHVGRIVRTKGLRDVIRALAKLEGLPDVRLTSAGDGPDMAACQAEAETLGVADRVTFLGRIPRAEVDQLYKAGDVFCFPSFREPMGGVFFEAMEYALPVIAANRGGPAFILDDACAIRLDVNTPDQFSTDIARAITQLATQPTLRRQMGNAAAARLRSFGGWSDKAADLERLYRQAIEEYARRAV